MDVARLRKGLEFIAAHPEEHNQATYAAQSVCGTTMCLAGTIVHQAGYTFKMEHYGNEPRAARLRSRMGFVEQWVTGAAHLAVNPDTEETVQIGLEARRLLGMSEHDSDRLFHEAITVRHLYRVANEVTGGEIEIPIELQ